MPEKMDAIALLKADHRKVEGLFEQFESSRSESKKGEIARQICMELIVHTQIEEEIFYPAVRPAVEKDLMDESYVEHDGAKMLIAEILASEPGVDFYDAKVKVLSEEIKHHVHEEEMRVEGMFSQARKGDIDMDALGERMMARKQALTAEYKANGLPTPTTRSMIGAKVEHGEPVDA